MKIKLAKYVSKYMVDNGIKDCFMVTGGGAMHLDDAIGHQDGMNVVFNHHEQACAIAAEAYARMTGNIALVSVTSGPGGTNAITGVMGGYVDSIPMFVISGQVKRETTISACPELPLRQLGDQEIDIISEVKSITKYAVFVNEPLDISYHLEKALFLAKNGRPGPVWLDIPLDVQGAMIETDNLRHFDAAAEGYDDSVSVDGSQIREILSRIRSAKAPLILVGTGVRLAGAQKELLQVIDKLKIPVVTAWNANDTVAYDNPYFAGMPGTVGTRPGNFAVQNCDVILSLACRLNIRMIGYNKYDFAKNAYKIVVDIDEAELRKPTIKADLAVNADVKDVLNGILNEEYEANPVHENWVKYCKSLLLKYPVVLSEYRKKSDKLNPYVFMDTLFDRLNSEDRIICGNGSACVMTFQASKIKQGQRMFTNSGCAAMGYGFPAAVGVAVADNSKRTICIDGDGSFMMNIQELATVMRNELNIKIILLNNNGYHSIRQTQNNLFEPPHIGIDPESGVAFPHFDLIAQAFDIGYYSISDMSSLETVLEDAINSEGACIVEVIVDEEQTFAPKSSSKVLPDGKIVSPTLDDMAPFLSREEYENAKFSR